MNQEYIKIKNDLCEIISKLNHHEIDELTTDIINKCKNVKLFIKNNPDNKISKEIVKILKSYYINNLNNQKLINAINLDDKRKYYKEQEIFKNLPLLDQANILFFNNIIDFPSEYYGNIPNYYKGIFWFLETNNCLIDKEYKNTIINYIDNHKELFYYTKSKFNTIEEEKKNHSDALNGCYTDDYYEFIAREKSIATIQLKFFNEKDAYLKYLYKKIGNIGELDFYMYVEKLPYTVHTSKELSDGFGYDIYCYDEKRETEQLIEIKTTTSLDKETFELTEKEYQEMINTLENKNTEYFVCITSLDIQNDYKPKHQLLKAIDEYTFISGDGEIEYIMDHTQKDKISFMKNSYVKRR